MTENDNMNPYETKQAARRERMADRAERLHDKANAEFRKADLREEVSGIPFGQPILVGHHSEGRHRRTLARADAAMRRGIEAQQQAKELERRANTISHAISSDDPDAVAKLKAKLAGMVALQDKMKTANRLFRKGDTTALVALVGEDTARNMAVPDFCGRKGFPDYALTNNNANIRRVRQRIEELTRRESFVAADDIKGDGWTLREDADENRIMFEFDGKPPVEVRAVLKGHGFKWSPSRMAWVRMLNGAGRFAAQQVTARLNDANPEG